MSMEEYERACLQREADAEREREAEERKKDNKTYAVTEGFQGKMHYYDIAYRVDEYTDKEIRFFLIEHYLQFVDLLHEAGYKYFDDKLRFVNNIK